MYFELQEFFALTQERDKKLLDQEQVVQRLVGKIGPRPFASNSTASQANLASAWEKIKEKMIPKPSPLSLMLSEN